jgi:adenosylhomocysteine nucleosidase
VILFVASEGREFQGLVRHLRGGRRQTQWPIQFAFSGELNGKQAVLVADGPGPDLAARAAAEAGQHGEVDAVVSIGFCGGLDPRLEKGQIVIATAIVDRSGRVVTATALPSAVSSKGCPVKEKFLSMNRVAVTTAEKRALAATGAGAVEMEAAGLYRQASQWGAPFFAIRVVTDAADDEFSIDFNRMRDAAGRFSRSRIIVEACRHPFKRFPELLQFDRRCRSAALLLGDFIADCQF